MRYLLAVLSHGYPESKTAERCVDSFVEKVTPLPVAAIYNHDGPGWAYAGAKLDPAAGPLGGFTSSAGGARQGFCAATADLWRAASQVAPSVEATHVFWLEHDFVFTRPLDLAPLAAVLDAHLMLAQMALMRDPVNQDEKRAGGLVESRPGEYEQVFSGAETGAAAYPWLRHRSYFTTNPSLMRADFMAQEPWPAYMESECEGRFGIELKARGYSFGVWGGGEPWVDHVGVRDGFGY